MINATEPVQKVSNYLELQPLMASLKAGSDNLPKTSLPTETEGTIQSNAHLLPKVTLYNAHGILIKTNPNSLIGYA
jgi:hypothetical protein